MAQVLRSYKEYIEQTRKVLYYEQDCLTDIFSEHREILEAIKRRDSAGAKAAMARHLEGSQRRAKFVYNITE